MNQPRPKYWTQAQVARLLNVSRQRINQLARHKRNPIPFEKDVKGGLLFVRQHNLVTWLEFENKESRFRFDCNGAIEKILS